MGANSGSNSGSKPDFGVQFGAAIEGNRGNARTENSYFSGDLDRLPILAGWQHTPRGVEHPADTPQKLQFTLQSGADSGAHGARNGPQDPELAAVVEAWPTLSTAIKERILAIIQTAN
jgi:hypothetical protein